MTHQTQSMFMKTATAAAFIAFAAGGLGFLSLTQTASASPNLGGSDELELPETMQLDAVIRDFRAYNNGATGGHPDFQTFSGSTTVGLVAEYLDEQGNPVSSGNLRGFRISSQYKDSAGRNINPAIFNADLGDTQGSLSAGPNNNGFSSEESFSQWYRDVPGVNLSKAITLTLNRVGDSNQYVFDSSSDQEHGTGGFFPVNDDLYGNYTSDKNFHFTTEINTEFTYERDAGQVFKFTGDDDVWVFIDGRLVIDLGGLHSKSEQFLDLDRLDWLQDGTTYSFDIFHAERRTSGSNFRIETTLSLRSIELPPTAALYD